MATGVRSPFRPFRRSPVSPVALRPGFTLVEALVAMFVLASVSAGLLATTWRLVGFAQDQADQMAADAYCHDLMWAVYSQKYREIRSLESFRLDPEKELPQIETTEFFGARSVVVPMLRNYRREIADNGFGVIPASALPVCKVDVTESLAASNKTITVSLSWGGAEGEASHRSHSLTVVRSGVDR